MNRTKKYLLALLPALVLWAGCSNMLEELQKTASKTGSGFPANAVFIYTADEFNAVRNDLAGYYVLMADIDLSGYGNWVPIGDYTNRFTGTLDGNGHIINNLTINGTANYQGLFGCIGAGGTVMNLGVSGSVIGHYSIGGLVGYNEGTIENCYTSGSIYGTGGSSAAGGLAGYNNGGAITNCYSSSDVDYTFFDVRIGGLVGINTGSVISCYFTDDSDNGFGTRKTSGWADPLTFTGWNFTTVWAIDDTGTINSGYPYLRSIPPGP